MKIYSYASGRRPIVVPEKLSRKSCLRIMKLCLQDISHPRGCLINCANTTIGKECMETYKRDVNMCCLCFHPGSGKVKETTLLCIPVGEPFQCVGMDLRRWTLVQMETDMPWFSRVISLSGLRFSLLRTDLQLQWRNIWLS